LLESFAAAKMDFATHSVNFEGLVGRKELGLQVLQTTFEFHEMAWDEIIQQSKFRVIYLKPQQSSPVIKLLDQLELGVFDCNSSNADLDDDFSVYRFSPFMAVANLANP
jgi:hypothetical protein